MLSGDSSEEAEALITKENIDLPRVLDHAFIEQMFARFGKDIPPEILNLILNEDEREIEFQSRKVASLFKRKITETIKEHRLRRDHVDQRRFTDKQIMFGTED